MAEESIDYKAKFEALEASTSEELAQVRAQNDQLKKEKENIGNKTREELEAAYREKDNKLAMLEARADATQYIPAGASWGELALSRMVNEGRINEGVFMEDIHEDGKVFQTARQYVDHLKAKFGEGATGGAKSPQEQGESAEVTAMRKRFSKHTMGIGHGKSGGSAIPSRD